MVRQPVIDEALSKAKKAEEDEENEEQEGGEDEGSKEDELEDEEEEDESEKAKKAMAPPPAPDQQPPAQPAPPMQRPGQPKPGQVAKADLTEADLQKSLDALAQIVQQSSPADRKTTLLEKAKTEDLNKSERDELFSLMGGAPQPVQKPLADTIVKGMRESDTIQKAIDVSDYLSAHQEELVKALTSLAGAVESEGLRQHEFNLVLARAAYDQGLLVKAMSERLGVIESQPARGPKSAGLTQPLQKSFVGGQNAGEFTRGQILNAMTDMMAKSMVDGTGGKTRNGEDLAMAVAKYESAGQISKSMLADVAEFRKARQTA